MKRLQLTITRIQATFIGLLLVLLMPSAWALEAVELNDGGGKWTPTQAQQAVLIDPTRHLSIHDILAGHVQFKPAWQDVINLGYNDTSVWVHLKLDNRSVKKSDPAWILEIAYARLSKVDIYLTESGTLVHEAGIGYDKPMSSRTLAHHFFAEPLNIEAGHQYDLYLNIERKGGGIQIPLHIYRQTDFTNYVADNNAVYGLYFGIMFAMLVYNSFLLLSVGHRAYFYYLLHIAFTCLTFQIIYGYAFKYLWPEIPVINEYALQMAVTIAAVAGLLFTRHYIEVDRYQRWMNPAITVMIITGSILILVRLFTAHMVIREVALYVGLATFCMTSISLICWRMGSRAAGFFLLAWIVFLTGATLHLLTLSGALPANSITTFSVIIGSALEVLLLSLGLADRINNEKRARYLALQEKHEAIISLKHAEETLIQRAMHSATTGLPNRALLRSRLEQSCNQPSPFYLLLLSLDNFHEFNKTLGHNNGDAILKIIALEIEKFIRDNGNIIVIEASNQHQYRIACIEGVTFALMLNTDTDADTEKFCKKLLANIERPFEFQGLTLEVNASVGITRYPDHGTNHEDLLRNAHIALEMAANTGGRIAIYSREMDPYNARRISLLAELREAIKNDKLELYLQPQIALSDQTVVGVEVLVRWQHPEHGFVAPAEFIPLAERTGVIHPLTYWVVRKSFELCQEINKAGYNLNFSINISVRNLQAAGFTQKIVQFAQACAVAMGNITMELTETAVMIDREDALKVMNELASAGVRLSIDDFGTGYSSLSYLKQLPVDEIKIDRSFVKDMLTNKDDHVIVHTTLSMGHNLGLKVVAEGIEDAETLERLKSMGCDMAQGYHIAKPMSATAFKEWLERNAKGKVVGL